MFKRKYFMAIILIVMLIMAGCKFENASSSSSSGATGKSDSTSSSNSSAAAAKTPEASPVATDGGAKPIVTIEMEDGAKIKVELYPNIAPNTVKNFISLVQKGSYNGLIYHRVIPGFMIQGGDPEGTGMGGPGYAIKGEFTNNGVSNTLKHTRGVISMARAQDPNSAGSQFFIMVADSPNLDGDYAAFGKVTEGMEEVDKIVNLPRDTNDRPTTPPKMKTVTVDTQGVKYAEPEIIKK